MDTATRPRAAPTVDNHTVPPGWITHGEAFTGDRTGPSRVIGYYAIRAASRTVCAACGATATCLVAAFDSGQVVAATQLCRVRAHSPNTGRLRDRLIGDERNRAQQTKLAGANETASKPIASSQGSAHRPLVPPRSGREVPNLGTGGSGRRVRPQATVIAQPTPSQRKGKGRRVREGPSQLRYDRHGHKPKSAGEEYADRVVPSFKDTSRAARGLAPDLSLQQRMSREYAERERREQLDGVSIHGKL